MSTYRFHVTGIAAAKTDCILHGQSQVLSCFVWGRVLAQSEKVNAVEYCRGTPPRPPSSSLSNQPRNHHKGSGHTAHGAGFRLLQASHEGNIGGNDPECGSS